MHICARARTHTLLNPNSFPLPLPLPLPHLPTLTPTFTPQSPPHSNSHTYPSLTHPHPLSHSHYPFYPNSWRCTCPCTLIPKCGCFPGDSVKKGLKITRTFMKWHWMLRAPWRNLMALSESVALFRYFFIYFQLFLFLFILTFFKDFRWCKEFFIIVVGFGIY